MRTFAPRICLALFGLAGLWSGGVGSVEAQPRVDSVCVDGDEIVVRGDGFPPGEALTPLFFDDFDDGSPGDAVADRPGWTMGAVTPRLSDERALSGGLSGVADGDSQWVQAYIETLDLLEVYASSWIFVQSGGAENTSSLKIMRFNGAGEYYRGSPSFSFDSMPTASGRNTLYSMRGSPDGTYEYQYGRGFSYGRWIRVELYDRLSQPAGARNGLVEAWLGGRRQEILEGERVTRDVGESSGITSVGFWQGWARRPEGARIHVDDTYVGRTRARVELGDGASFADAETRNIQLATASDGALRFRPRLGPLDTGGPLYVLVVDEEGRAGDGMPLTGAPCVRPHDGGAVGTDAGIRDDANVPSPDAATVSSVDGSLPASASDGGCSAVHGRSGHPGLAVILLLLALPAVWRAR